MWRSKKFIIITVTVAAVVAGCLAGVVFANPENGDDSQPESKYGALLDRVCEVYKENTGVTIDPQQLRDAFVQAQSEMRDEALDRCLQKLVDEGKITEDEAGQYKEWWQARPDMEPYRQQLRDWQQARPGIPSELEEWKKAMPDIPFKFEFGGRRVFRSIGGMRGFGGPCTHME